MAQQAANQKGFAYQGIGLASDGMSDFGGGNTVVHRFTLDEDWWPLRLVRWRDS